VPELRYTAESGLTSATEVTSDTSAALFPAEAELKFRLANHSCCNWASFRAHATHSSSVRSADWLSRAHAAHFIGWWFGGGAWVWATRDAVHARQPAGRGKAAGSDRTRECHQRPSNDSPRMPSDHTANY
jgi:hypothetical protein